MFDKFTCFYLKEIQNLSLRDLVLIALFAILLAITISKEIKRFDPLAKYYPLLMGFIPRWSFFAPIPNSFDYYLVYRGFLSDGTPQDWQEAYEIKNKRPFYSMFWNPEKRFLKGFLDILLDLVEFSNKAKNKRLICTSIPYLHILNYIDALDHRKSIERMQFMILCDSKIRDYEVVFRSEIHPLRKKKID